MIETMSWTQKTNPSICEWIIQTGFVNQITLIQKINWKYPAQKVSYFFH